MRRMMYGVLAVALVAGCGSGEPDLPETRPEFYAFVEDEFGMTVVDESAADQSASRLCDAFRVGGEEAGLVLAELFMADGAGDERDAALFTAAIVSTYCPEFIDE